MGDIEIGPQTLDVLICDKKRVVELYDLQQDQSSGEQWNESARWIKYEEDIEGIDRHWGRPHVAFLTFQSLLKIRLCLSKGAILFNVPAANPQQMIDVTIDALISHYQLDNTAIKKLAFTLNRQRLRRQATRQVLRQLSIDSNNHSRKSSKVDSILDEEIVSGTQSPTLNENPPTDVQRPDSRETSFRQRFGRRMSRINSEENFFASPDESWEAIQVYCGVVPGLPTALVAFLRLLTPIQQVDSARLPLRIFAIIVGPSTGDFDYHELGRSLCTLLANASFARAALTGETKQDVLRAIDEFLDDSVVIPPGDIDNRMLLNADDVRKALRQRKLVKIEGAKEKDEIKRKEKAKADAEEPPSPKGRIDHVKDALRRTKRPFGGVIDDIKYRLPYYVKDYTDSLNFICVTSCLFMFFANFASAVAFGEVMGVKTDGWMGVTEILIAHGICGVVWGLFAAQPLCIQAAVGPFLVFEESLYKFCKDNNIDFLAVRIWTGLWALILMLIVCLLEGSFLVRYLTPFTEDIFTGLIALIFIWEAIKFLYNEYVTHPLQPLHQYCDSFTQNRKMNETQSIIETELFFDENSTKQLMFNDSPLNTHWYQGNNATETGDSGRLENQPDTALLTLILVVFTFLVAYSLKKLRTSVYLGRTMRKVIGDFAVPIAVIITVFLDKIILNDTYLRHLDIPTTFGLTNSTIRSGWFINPLGNNGQSMPLWAIWASVVPAILVGILVFAEVEIIEFLISKPERGVKRPHGFHWDLIICSLMIFVCALFGLPWMCPAAVQSLSHVSSLTILKKPAPGAVATVDRVVEQRVTCIVVGLLHAAAAFAGIILQLIPVAALFGLFVFLGVMGLVNLEFVHRLFLLLVPRKYFPDQYQMISFWRLHLFTLVQLICFAILWAVNMVRSAALAFPFVLTLVAVFRKFAMPYMFTESELQAVDAKKQPELPSDEGNSENLYATALIPM